MSSKKSPPLPMSSPSKNSNGDLASLKSQNPSGTDRRHFSRVGFKATGEITQNGKTAKVEIIDLSLKGVLIKDTQYFEMDVQSPLQLIVALSDNAAIDMLVKIVRRDTAILGNKIGDNAVEPMKIVGCECISIDNGSLTHLRRLIELNTGIQGAAERELATLFTTQIN